MKENSATILAVGDIILELPAGGVLSRTSGSSVANWGYSSRTGRELFFTSRGIDTFPEFSGLQVVRRVILALWLVAWFQC